ncbi:MAG TPA: DUF167 domain-containing protein [Candidatus Limnocylindria bacterium]|nr:DUF167 domain-containing protein [Candidatus Limnocylindria bacterium]
MPDLEVAVTPRSAADRVGPFVDGVLRVRVTRPPADGEANRAVIRLVARALELAPSRLALVSGERSRRKRLRVDGIGDEELVRRLAGIGPGD